MSVKKNLILLITALCFIFLGSVSFAAEYYISNAGDDTNLGTSSGSPWEHAPGMVGCSDNCDITPQPGDIFYFNRGDTWRDSWTIASSGDSDDQITYTAYGSGDLPKFYGSAAVSSWSGGPTLWTATLASDPDSLWFIETNGDVRWGTDVLTDTPDAEYEWKHSGTTLTVYAASDPTSRYSSVEYPTRWAVIDVSANSYLTFSYLDICYAWGWDGYIDQGAGIGRLPSGDVTNIIVEYCDLHHNGFLSNTSTAHQGNGIVGYNFNNSIIRKNQIHHNGRRGIFFRAENSTNSLDDNTIRENEIYDNYHANVDLFLNTAGGADGNQILYNLIYTTSDITVGPLPAAVPTVHGILLGIDGSSYYITNTLILGNVLFEHNLDAAIHVRVVNGLKIYANTIYGYNSESAGAYGIYIQSQATASSNIDIRNNIVSETGVLSNVGPLRIDASSSVVSTCENNLWYNPGGVFVRVDSTDYSSGDQAAYKSATGWDDDGLWEGPVFADAANNNFTLAGSPAINAAVSISEYNDRLNPNSSWPDNVSTCESLDIGAFADTCGSIQGVSAQ